MRMLLRVQWRFVRTSAIVFTLLGVLVEPLLVGARVGVTIAAPQASVFVAWLAASLAGRLFGRSAIRDDSSYLRSLPISRSRWFASALSVGLAVLLISTTIQWAFWSSPVNAWLVEANRSQSYGPLRSDLQIEQTLALSILTFSTTTYFALSLQRPVAAAQAGLLGYLASLVLYTSGIGAEILLHPTQAWMSVGLLSGLALGVAAVLDRRRGTAAVSAEERLLGPRTRSERALHFAAQATFATAPLAICILVNSAMERAASPALAGLAVSLSAGLLCLPWTIREASALGWNRPIAWVAVLLRTIVLGAPLWSALGGPEILRCARCRRVRTARVTACPACGARATAPPHPRTVDRWIPTAPWSVAIALALVSIVVAEVAKQLPATRREDWIVRADLPGVLLAMKENSPPTTCVHIHRERSLSPVELAAYGSGCGVAPESTSIPNPVAVSSLRAALREMTTTGVAIRNDADAELLPIPEGNSIVLGDRRRGDSITGVSIAYSSSDFTLSSQTILRAGLPRLEERVEAILDLTEARALDSTEIQDAALLGDPLVSLLVRGSRARAMHHSPPPPPYPNHLRWEPWAGRHGAAIDSIIRTRYGIRAEREDRGAALRTLEDLRSRSTCLRYIQVNGGEELPAEFEYLYEPLRGLAIAAPTDLLRDEIRDRNGMAAIAAGMRHETALYDDCRTLLSASLSRMNDLVGRVHPLRTQASFAAAYAMLSMDRERAAVDILDELLKCGLDRNQGVVLLLRFSGSSLVRVRLEALGTRVDDPWDHAAVVMRGIDRGWTLDQAWPGN